MLKLTAVKIFRAVFCALQKVSFSAQNGQSFQACLFPLVLLINISFEVIFFYGFHRLLYTTVSTIFVAFIFLPAGLKNLSLKALATTQKLLILIAAAPNIGVSFQPKTG